MAQGVFHYISGKLTSSFPSRLEEKSSLKRFFSIMLNFLLVDNQKFLHIKYFLRTPVSARDESPGNWYRLNLLYHGFPIHRFSVQFSRVWLFATPRTVACQASLSMEFCRKNTGVSCCFLLRGIFLTQGLKPRLLHLLHKQAESLPGKLF